MDLVAQMGLSMAVLFCVLELSSSARLFMIMSSLLALAQGSRVNELISTSGLRPFVTVIWMLWLTFTCLVAVAQ